VETIGGVLVASGEAKKRILALSRVAVGIASVRWWINRSYRWQKDKHAEHEADDRKAAPQSRPAD